MGRRGRGSGPALIALSADLRDIDVEQRVTPGIFSLRFCDRIAQYSVDRVEDFQIVEVKEEELGGTERGEKGFGASGR